MTQLIMLNGGSSAGKSSIARSLQTLLPENWLTFGVDVMIDALPGHGEDPRSGLVLEPDGAITVTSAYRTTEDAWYAALATMARAGVLLILDEVLLAGGAGQQRLEKLFVGLDLFWVGVQCDPDVAATREAARGDRITGMARSQATLVHQDVHYDLIVDSSTRSVDQCARAIVEELTTPTESQH